MPLGPTTSQPVTGAYASAAPLHDTFALVCATAEVETVGVAGRHEPWLTTLVTPWVAVRIP